MKIVFFVLMFVSVNSFGKVIAFNLGSKFMIQIQDSVKDSDGTDLYNSLDITPSSNSERFEFKQYALMDNSKKIFELRCTKFYQNSSIACTLKVHTSKYTKIDLIKKEVKLLVNDEKASGFSEIFFDDGRVYEDDSNSLSIDKKESSSVYLKYSY